LKDAAAAVAAARQADMMDPKKIIRYLIDGRRLTGEILKKTVN